MTDIILEDAPVDGPFGRERGAWVATYSSDTLNRLSKQLNDDAAAAEAAANSAKGFRDELLETTKNKVEEAPKDDTLWGRKNGLWYAVPEVLSFPVTEFIGDSFDSTELLIPHDYTTSSRSLSSGPVHPNFALTGNYYITVRQLDMNSVVQQVQNDVGDLAFRHALLENGFVHATPWKVVGSSGGDFGIKTLPSNTLNYTVTVQDVSTPVIKAGIGCQSEFTISVQGGDLPSYLASGFVGIAGQEEPAFQELDTSTGPEAIPAGMEFIINNAGAVPGKIAIAGVAGSIGGVVDKVLTIKPGDSYSLVRDSVGNNWFALGGAGGGVDVTAIQQIVGEALSAHGNDLDPHPQYVMNDGEVDKTYLVKNGKLLEYVAPTVDPNLLVRGLTRKLVFNSVNQTGYVSGNIIASFIADEPFIVKNSFEGSQADYTLGDLYTVLPNNAIVAVYQLSGTTNTRIGSIQFTPGQHTPAFIQYQASNTIAKDDKVNFVVDTLVGVASLTVNFAHKLA